MNAQAGEKNSDSKSGDEWVFSVSSYLWAAGITGTAGTLPNLPPTEVDESFSDIFDDLDFAGMMMVSARKGRFGMTGDLQYVETTAKDTAAAPIFLSQELVSKSFMLSLLGEYVALQEGNSVLRLSAGARLWSVDTELKLSSGLLPGIPGINVKHNETWVDPVVGVSGSVDVIGKVFLSGWGYVGGFGAGSDIMADLFGGVGYRFTDSISSRIGYRWMKVDYENDGFLYDVRQEGLIAGITFQF